MEIDEFLQTVVTTDGPGHFCMPVSHADKWYELWFIWPDDIDQIVSRVKEVRDSLNVHFTSYLFDKAESSKQRALTTRTIQADLDNADIRTLPIEPTVLVQTSPHRYHGYWVLEDAVDLAQHEDYSRRLTYSIPLCDRSGWNIAKKLRIPDTFNYKYEERQPVSVVSVNPGVIPVSVFDLLQPVIGVRANTDIEGWIELSTHEYGVGPQELLNSIKDRVPPTVVTQYGSVQEDRSGALWSLMCSAFRAGLSREAVFWLAKFSANNKFSGLRYNADRELAKDVVRAEEAVRTGAVSLRELTNNARRIGGARADKLQYLQSVVQSSLNETGDFRKSNDGRLWYVDRETGRPIVISQRSEQLDALLDTRYALNSVEQEQRYVSQGLLNYTNCLPDNAVATNLSYYDEVNKTMYIHTGKRDVVIITPGSVTSMVNGQGGIIFPWTASQEAFMPDYTSGGEPWYEILFRESVENVVSLTGDQAVALYRVWLLFLLFRQMAVTRPILTILGQPGSGKSTLFRKIYALLYGGNRSVSAVTTPENYDRAVAYDPFVVLDNVDTYEKWLPDRLALSASASDIIIRKLWTDNDVIILKRQALIGITAHAPKFGREDVADRMLLINLERLTHFKAEGEIIRGILTRRNQLWGGIIKDVQKILNQPEPNKADIPQLRIEDFARIGWWIACALGIEKTFGKALDSVRAGQHAFSLGEDSLIVSAIINFTEKSSKYSGQFMLPGLVWSQLELHSGDPNNFKKTYHDAQSLAKKLWALQDSLRAVVKVDHRVNTERGTREWLLGKKDVG